MADRPRSGSAGGPAADAPDWPKALRGASAPVAKASSTGVDRFVAVAEIVKPHGIRGELGVRMFNEGSDLLLGKPVVRLALPDGTERAATLASVRRVAKGLLVQLAGVVDRNGAEELRGANVLAKRDGFAPLDEGEFYACDVEGARVLLRGAEADFGRVKTIIEYPSCDVLVVERAEGGVLEVPLVEPYVARVDVEGGVVELATIDGLT